MSDFRPPQTAGVILSTGSDPEDDTPRFGGANITS